MQRKLRPNLDFSIKVATIAMIATSNWILPELANWELPKKFIAKIATMLKKDWLAMDMDLYIKPVAKKSNKNITLLNFSNEINLKIFFVLTNI